MIVYNRLGEEVGEIGMRIYPIRLGEDRSGYPVYNFVLVEVPILDNFPEIIWDICDN